MKNEVRLSKLLGSRSFTLIELLAVISVLILLAGIIFGVSTSIQRRARESRARGEMAIIAQALERYKEFYGDYPWIDSGSNGAREIYAALIGRRSPTGAFVMDAEGRLESREDPLVNRKGKELLSPTQLATSLPDDGGTESRANRTQDSGYAGIFLIDPWGRPYLYSYRVARPGSSGKASKGAGYLLLSSGPDEEVGFTLPEDGVLPDNHGNLEEGRDNLYLGGD